MAIIVNVRIFVLLRFMAPIACLSVFVADFMLFAL